MSLFKIETNEAGNGIVVARLEGRLNAVSSPEVKERLKSLIAEDSHNLVLDLSDVSFIDSSGLSALVAGYKAAAEAGGSLKLACMMPQVSEVFFLTHLDRVFETYPELGAALASFSQHR
jgi:anti-sigma B factor antagonist